MIEQISLYSNEWYEADSIIKFFIGNKVRIDNIDIMQDVINKILNSWEIVIGNYKEEPDGYSFNLLIEEYYLGCIKSNKNNIAVTYIRYIDNEKYYLKKKLYENPILKIIFRKKPMIIIGSDSNHIFPREYESISWDMELSILDEIGMRMEALYESFDKDNKNKYNIGIRFRKLILDKIREYTSLEDELEKYLVTQGSSLYYIKRVSTTSSKLLKNYTYCFYCRDFDEESFYIGTRVSVETNIIKRTGDFETVDGVIIDILLSDEETIIEISFSKQFNDSDIPEHGRIYIQHNPLQRKVREKVVESIENSEVLSTYMYKTFNSFETEGFDSNTYWKEFEEELDNSDNGFKPNEGQKEAIRKGIETRDIQLVLGPPGTGKTTVITAWVKYYVKHGMKVLVSSQNNTAVDNVLSRVAKDSSIRIIRIGNENKVQDEVKCFLPERQDEIFFSRFQQILSLNKTHIENDIDKLKAMEEILFIVTGYLTECRSIEVELRMLYNEMVYQMAEQKNRYDDIISLEKDLNIIIENIAKKEIYIEENAKSKWIVRVLRFICTKGVKKDISKLNNRFRHEYEKYVNEINLYNEQSNSIMNSMKNYDTLCLKNRYLEIAEELAKHKDLKVDFQLPYDNIACSIGLNLSHINQMIIEVDDFRMQCTNVKQNITKLKSALQEWEEALNGKRNEIMTNMLIENADVVGATCIGININKKFLNVDFDVAIIDEAGQIQIHNIIVPMTRAKKNLLLGDYLQIPPIVNENMKELCKIREVKLDLLEMSFFEYLFTNDRFPEQNKSRLNLQFRMPAEIADIISHQFYEDEYFSVEGKKCMDSFLPNLFRKPLVLIDSSDSKRRKETKHINKGYSNDYEIELIICIISRIFKDYNSNKSKNNVLSKDIGIIAPYSKQVQQIRRGLKEHLDMLSAEEINSMVATLDSFQGQERKLIIYSSTRSNDRAPECERIGFMKELRRLNVAFTRCQEQLIIIGDMNFLSSCEYEDKLEGYDAATIKSEKEFSMFFKYLIDKVKTGSGEYLYSIELLNQRCGG